MDEFTFGDSLRNLGSRALLAAGLFLVAGWAYLAIRRLRAVEPPRSSPSAFAIASAAILALAGLLIYVPFDSLESIAVGGGTVALRRPWPLPAIRIAASEVRAARAVESARTSRLGVQAAVWHVEIETAGATYALDRTADESIAREAAARVRREAGLEPSSPRRAAAPSAVEEAERARADAARRIEWQERPAPVLDVRDLDGGTVSLAALRGRVVLVLFFDMFHSQVLHEMTSLAGDPGSPVVIGVEARHEPSLEQGLRATCRNSGVTFAVGFATPEVHEAWGLRRAHLPMVVAIDGGGARRATISDRVTRESLDIILQRVR